MDQAAVTVTRLAERVSKVAALALGFAVGTVRVQGSGPDAVRHSHQFPSGSLALASERLDGEVARTGLPRAVDDLSGAVDVGGSCTGCYAGVPIRLNRGVVGVVSVADAVPRVVGQHRLRVLVELSKLLSDRLGPDEGATTAGTSDEASEAIAAALAAGELRPWYQPIVDLSTGQVLGMEALARWHRPDGSVELPAAFVPIAERSDLILQVDRSILAQAVTDLAVWQRHRPDFRISVNLSGRHLDDPAVVENMDAAVAAAGVLAGTVDLEITETSRPTDLVVGAEVLARLTERGYTVWFDDFGSGWSALQDLIRLPVGGIKLDRSFAEHLGTPVDDAVIAAFARATAQVGLKMILEGIETPEQADRARRLGCRIGQGHLWSKARPASEVTALIAS